LVRQGIIIVSKSRWILVSSKVAAIARLGKMFTSGRINLSFRRDDDS
jgi:hypothetical protein